MFHAIEKRIQEAVSAHLKKRHDLDFPIAVEQPRESSFGELALPVAFQLAKKLRKAPKLIATELVEELAAVEGISSLEVAGNGYINVRLNRGYLGRCSICRAPPRDSISRRRQDYC